MSDQKLLTKAEIGRRVKRREKLGLGVRELARRCGVSAQSILRWEDRERNPRVVYAGDWRDRLWRTALDLDAA